MSSFTTKPPDPPKYSPAVTASKAGNQLLFGIMSAAGGAIALYLANPENAQKALDGAGMSEAAVALVVPAIVAAGKALGNYLKNKDLGQ